MTKTLEFVNIGIENQTKKLNVLKREKDYYETLNKIEDLIYHYDDKINHINLQIENIEFNLEHMNQIKTELEAWEEIKKRLIREKYSIFHSKDCSVHNYTRIYLKEIKEDENTEEYQILKKALEIKDEKEN